MPWDIEELDPDTRAGLIMLGEAFSRLRGGQRMSQRELAQRIGLSQSSISRFEAGLAPGTRARHLARMLVVLRAEVDTLGLPDAKLHPRARDPLIVWAERMAQRDERRFGQE